MIRLALRVQVKAVRLGWPPSSTVWVGSCPGCPWRNNGPDWRTMHRMALDHATHCPELRRLNWPVTLGRPS